MRWAMEAPRNIVGPQVIKLRLSRDWSQERLALACQLKGWDVSRGVIARIEGGVRWISDFELLKLAATFRVSVQELYPRNAQRYFKKR